MKRLHWFDQKEAEVQRQKARMEKEEEIRRKIHIEEEEIERITDETRQCKSDSCSSITHFHSSILHSTTEHTSKLC